PSERLVHRREHSGMLSHAEIVIRAPYRDFANTAGVVMPGAREGTGLALQIGKDAIASFMMETFKLPAEMGFVVHDILPLTVAAGSMFQLPISAAVPVPPSWPSDPNDTIS